MNLLDYQTLRFERDGALLTVALNRPELMNATNALMELELCRFFTEASVDKEASVIILTGTGKAFCDGGDFAYINEAIDRPGAFWDALPTGKRLITSILDCSKPIVAKINGHAIGLGATLALFCDVSFAAEHAKIADPHVAIGFTAGDGGAVIWPQLIGYDKAKEYLFTGDPILAPEAARMGLINHCVPSAELDERVKEYALKVASMPPRAVTWTKACVNIGLKQLTSSILDASLAYEALSNSTQDHREAMSAIREKRKAIFSGE